MSIKQVLDKQISLIKLSKDEEGQIKKEAEKFVQFLKKSLKGFRVDIFIGGSLAKNTLIRKKVQDIDIFLRFNKNYDEEKINKIMNNLKLNYGERIRVHGSRDYLRFKKQDIVFEVVPVLKINNPREARNITDLSYFHVNYILKQIKKNKKLGDEIKLAKNFCFVQNCYGAESFIRGFSGYGLELLIAYYGSFVNFLKQIIKSKDKIIIDPSKFYKNKKDVLFELNEAKLQSPIIFVDPTFKQRNALAALSQETFSKLKNTAGKFIKNPSVDFFKAKEINRREYNLILKAKTENQEGDIAGTKLLKFFDFFTRELERHFSISKKDFKYNDKKKAEYYFKIKPKNLIFNGPPVKMKIAVAEFKKAHKKTYIKAGKIYAKEKIVSSKQFLSNFKKKYNRAMKDMGIISLG